MSSPLETVLKGVRTVLLGNGTSKLFLILFEFGIARFLGASAFGLYAIALAVSQIVSNICLLGMNYGVIQYLAIYQEKGDPAKVKNAIFFSLLAVAGFAGLIAFFMFMSADRLAVFFFQKPLLVPLLKLAAPLIFFDAVNQCVSAVFRGLRQFRRNLISYDLLKNALCFLVFPVMVYAGGNVVSAMTICLFGSMTGFLYGIGVLFKEGSFPRRDEIDVSVLKELFAFSKILFLWNLLQVLAVRLFIIAAGVFLMAAETGTLAVATRLALVFIFFQTAVSSTVQAEFARFFHRKDIGAQKDLYQAVTQGLLAVVGAAGLLILINPVFVTGLFGSEYTQYAWLLWPLLFANFLNVVTGPAGQVLVANEKQKLLMGLTLLDIAMQLGFVVPLMSKYGVFGAAWGEAVRITLFVVLRLWFMQRDLGIHMFGRSYVKIVILFFTCLCSGLALTLAGFDYYIAAGYALLFYATGGVCIYMRDAKLAEELKMLLFPSRSQDRT